MRMADTINIIRDFYSERSAAELFQDLGRLCQKAHEKATDFILRAFELRQKAIIASEAEGGLYDDKLVRETFLRAVRTGLTDPQIRTHMREYLDPQAKTPASDHIILHEVNKAMGESEEANVKQKAATLKRVTIAETSTKVEETTEMAAALKPLVEGLASLQKQMNDIQISRSERPGRSEREDRNYPPSEREHGYNYGSQKRNYPLPRGGRDGNGTRTYPLCERCKENKLTRCAHCFNCGQESHYARQCTQKKN
jgi:hypothetical protein